MASLGALISVMLLVFFFIFGMAVLRNVKYTLLLVAIIAGILFFSGFAAF